MPHLANRHIRDRRTRLELASGTLDLDVISFSDEKIFKVDAAVPGHGFSHIFSGKLGRRSNWTSFFGKHHAKTGVLLLRRPNFEPLFMTRPSQVGSTTPWTLFAAMLRDPLSPDLLPSDYILWVHRLCHLVLSQHTPTDSSSRSTADSHNKLHLTGHHPIHAQNFTIRSHSTAQAPCLMVCLNVFYNFLVLIVFLVPVTYQLDSTCLFFDLKRRNKRTSLQIFHHYRQLVS